MDAIGVGCFWFARRGGEPQDKSFSPREHLEQIRKALESVDNVSSVEIETLAEDIQFYDLNEDSGIEDENYFPIFENIRITFRLFMPSRLIDKYSHGHFDGDGNEHFEVKIVYGRSLPVTFIHYPVSGGQRSLHDNAPSWTLMFVREYLKEKLADHKIIEFQSLGPSPFHADFFAERSKSEKKSIAKDISRPTAGYHTLLFECEKSNPRSPTEQLILYFGPLLSAYYDVVRHRNRSLFLNVMISELTQELIKPTNGFSTLVKWWRQGQAIDGIYRALLDEKFNRLRMQDFIKTTKNPQLFEQESFVSSFIDEEANDLGLTPHEEVREILALFEERRRGSSQNRTTLIAGLIGGVIGASLTFLLGYLQADRISEHQTIRSPAASATSASTNDADKPR